LQEAYVIADYERHNFSVAQALFLPTSVSQNIIPIIAPSQAPNSNGTASPPTKDPKSNGVRLSGGVTAGIVVAALVVLATGILAAVFWSKQKLKSVVPSLLSTDDDPSGRVPEISEDNALHELNVDATELQAHEGIHGLHELPSVAGLHQRDGRHLTAAEAEAVHSEIVPQ
jgi:hypothetical protein